MAYNFNNPPAGTGGPVIRWLVGAVQFLSRRLGAISGASNFNLANKQIFAPGNQVSLSYILEKDSPDFNVGVIVTGDVTGATGRVIWNSADDGTMVLEPISGVFDDTDNTYTGSNGAIGDIDDNPSFNSVVISDTASILYYDPQTIVTSATILLPANPVDGQQLYIYFGGIIHTGTVISSLTLSGFPDHSINPNTVKGIIGQCGVPIRAIYRGDNLTWYVNTSAKS